MELTGSGTVSVVNSTVTGNSIVNSTPGGGGGGIEANSTFTGMITLQNDTISGNASPITNGGGISWTGAAGSVFSVQNTIVAGNTAPAGPDANSAAGTFTDGGGNLIGVSGQGSGNTGFTGQTGSVTSPLNPLLGPLQNNGGPTLTLALLSGSPAIDRGVTNKLTVDQRGVSRPQGSAYDVGAYELNAGPTPTAKLSVLNHDFGDVGLGASASQTITLTNTGTGDLALSAVAFSGEDSGDFTVTPGAGCAAPATLAASQSCRYSVTFTPATQGPRTASLTFTDDTVNAPGSKQTVALVGNGITLGTTTTAGDFTISANPLMATITAGGRATFTFTVTPQNGFRQTVNFLCSGLPSGAQCSFAPSSITPANMPATSTLTVTTTAPSTASLLRHINGDSVLNAWLFFSAMLTGLFWVVASRMRRHGRTGARRLLVLAVVVLGTTAGLLGCGGSGNTTTVTKPVTAGTPAGTTQITVLATGGTTSHTVAVTLTVQ
jgi:hypothetical protein